MRSWLFKLDPSERHYWLGLLLLFAGLSWGVSVATGLTVVGAIIAGESVVTSYLAQWIKARQP
jgi:hypothetical protein